MRQLACFLTVLFLLQKTDAQDFSNKGKEFWIPYSYHVGNGGPALSMTLYLTSDVTTNYTIKIYGGVTLQSGTINAGQVIQYSVPNTYYLGNTGVVANKTVYVTSDKSIVVYSYITQSAVSGATVCLPTNVLGTEYYSMSYTQVSNSTNANSYIDIIAVEDNTNIEITPSGPTTNGWAAGSIDTILLNKGEIYQLLGTHNNTASGGLYYGTDLTGTKIKSIATGTSTCKKIAVFSGAGKMKIGANCGTNNSSDNLYQQLYPAVSWGRNYLTLPSYNRPLNYYRIIKKVLATNVYVNGTLINPSSFVNNRFYEFSGTTPNKITADQPISVAQFFTTAGCDGNPNPYDPDMIVLNPIEQTISKVTLVSSNLVATPPQHHIHVIIPNGGTGISSFKLDNNPVPASAWVVHPQNPAYSYAYFSNVTQGYHTIASDSGFNAMAYGYANAESYGYSAGANVKDLNQYVEIANPISTTKSLSTCINNDFKFSITLPFKPLKLAWDFKSNPDLGPNPTPLSNAGLGIEPNNTIPSPADPAKQLYVYDLPQLLHFTSIGTYPIDVNIINPTPDGCSGEQTLSFDIQVYDIPKATIQKNVTGCYTDPVLLSANSSVDGGTATSFIWTIDGQVLPAQSNPNISNSYSSPGAKPVSLQVISNFGCISKPIPDTVLLSDKPIVDFKPDSIACLKLPIKFTDQSTPVGNSTLAEWRWQYSDGQAADTYTSSSSTVNPTKTFTSNSVNVLLTVKTNSGCTNSLSKTITLNPNPVVQISTSSNVCLPSGLANFVNQTSISSGSLVAYAWDFGDANANASNPNADINPKPKHTYTAKGLYKVVLTATSDKGCVSVGTPMDLTVYPEPVANFDILNPEVCLNQLVTFKDKTVDELGNPMVKWDWIFSDAFTNITSQFNRNISTPGTYTVKFTGTSDKGCASNQLEKTFTIHQLPTADFKVMNPSCEKDEITFKSLAVSNNVGSLTEWSWNLDNGPSTVITNNTSADVKTIYAAWSSTAKNISLIVKDSKGCTNSKTISMLVNPKPSVSFTLPEICLNDAFASFEPSVTIADNSSNFKYYWSFGDPNASVNNPNNASGKPGTHKYTAARNYDVGLQVTTAAGCQNSITQAFTVSGANPVASFNVLNENALCSNTEVSLKNTSTVDFGNVSKLEIYWDYLNNPTVFETDENPTFDKIYKHLYANFQNPSLKNITVRLKAYSGGVCFNDKIQTIVLNGSPTVSFSSLPGICFEANPRQISETGFIDVSGINPGIGIYSGTGVNSSGLFDPAVSGDGTFTIKYLFTASNSCFASASQNIIVWPSPVADFTVSNINCEKTPITLTDKSIAKAGNIIAWNWNYGDASLPVILNNNSQYDYTYAGSGNYNLTLNVSTSNGCKSATKSIPILVSPLPLVDFDLPKVCMPVGRALFANHTTVSDGSALSYLWNFGDPLDPSSSTTADGLHYYKKVQSYIVNLKATSSKGCVNQLTKNLLDVFPRPNALFTSADSACIGTPIVYKDQSDGIVSPITTWNWTFGDGGSTGNISPSYQHRTTGSFTVMLSVITSEGCISDTASKLIQIFPYPKADAGPDFYILDDAQKIIQATASGNALTFKWTPSDYLNSTTVLTPTVVFPQNSLKYTLKVTGRGACSVTDDVAIKVLKMPKPPNTFTPNGDGINDLWDITNLSDYPGAITEVYDAQGKIVFRSVGYSKMWDGTYNGNILPIGTYYYVIDPKNGRNKLAGYVTILK